MSDQDIHQNRYIELRSIYKNYIDSYNALYQLKTENEGELNSIYKIIKTELIYSKKFLPQDIINDIFNIIPYNNRYTNSYFSLAKLISDEYRVKEVKEVPNFLYYKEHGIKLDKSEDFEKIKSENLDIHAENTIYRAIMYNDKERFIIFTEREEFDKDQKLDSKLYPGSGFSLLELCCYHGAVDCFKLLRTKFNSKITETCLQLSFLGGNPEIMSECLKYQKPGKECMRYAIISHNIDFVTFLMNEYNIEIDLEYCQEYKNLESFLVYYDQTNDINTSFVESIVFNIPSLCEYFLSNGANIDAKDGCRNTALHIAVYFNYKEITELLLSHGANINEQDMWGHIPLIHAIHYNNKELAELLILHVEKISEKDKGRTFALHYAVLHNNKEMAEFLILHGANINVEINFGRFALLIAADNNYKEMAEFLISHGANINKKNILGTTALECATFYNKIETAELLISHGAGINEKNKNGKTALQYAVENNRKEITEFLILYGANINEKDKNGKTALHYAAENNRKDITEFLILHGANINEKDKNGKTALHYAMHNNYMKIAGLLLSHGANLSEKDKNRKKHSSLCSI
ncbi:hypothetical protein TVAG_346210 [Trichomonas vaginalis G3]|uniref:DUF3447 domain-containing protein n=1 Tax=Trichomonas vaginalis (strain ATCC PRA-98 / G3) TaxID=412133 RepID=A2FK11_TRIV3|nr:ankyrin repeat and SOCS box-containing protein 4 family [Trichomonas vaginalis G3]EAX94758.1 hypothetical protein TVAG_346210 [Trichomonas vaginalis G3]KAI5491996.1 ankyrin repeat and SOCS box-containing protein 4 family [Trichomonas vaginalis G3]|eukprot:XP_001307688.1 hypothetical protein [Trichomonas vaginalis G3]